MFYLIFILISMSVISAINIICSPPIGLESAINIILSVVVGTVSVIAIDGLFALIIRRCMPKKWFSAERRIFRVPESERKFYRRLKINSWKDMVPELGGFTGFHKNKMSDSNDIGFLSRYLMESNFGVVIHIVNVFDGVLILLIPFCSALSVAIPIIVINALLSVFPVMILRFNTYSLKILYDRRKARSK